MAFDFQAYLQSDELAELLHFSKIRDTTCYSVSSGSISAIGSAATIWHILRSHKGLSTTTYNRLVFGLCVSVLMSLLSWSVGATAVPKDIQYLSSSARGNVGTCIAQGLIGHVGMVMAAVYNCSICFFIFRSLNSTRTTSKVNWRCGSMEYQLCMQL